MNNDIRFFFLGGDPAPGQSKRADDGALAVGCARPRAGIETPTKNLSDWQFHYVWAYVLRGKSAREWSGFIHLKHRHFGFSGMLIDPQGGGQWVNLELAKSKQLIMGVETDVTPIVDMENIHVVNGQMMLCMYRRRDPGIRILWPHLAGDDNLYEAMHIVMQEAVEHQIVTFPKPIAQREFNRSESPKCEDLTDPADPRILKADMANRAAGGSLDGWEEERRWALINLDAGREQLVKVQVATREDGNYLVTGNGAKTFSATGRKDIAYAMIFAYVRFLVWLHMDGPDFAVTGKEQGYCATF
jgi:hypothetical protein